MLPHKTILSGADSPPLTMTRLRMLTMIYLNTDSNNTRTTLLILATTEIAYSKPCVASFWNKIDHSSVKKTTSVLLFLAETETFLTNDFERFDIKNCTATNHSFLWLGIHSLRKIESFIKDDGKGSEDPRKQWSDWLNEDQYSCCTYGTHFNTTFWRSPFAIFSVLSNKGYEEEAIITVSQMFIFKGRFLISKCHSSMEVERVKGDILIYLF